MVYCTITDMTITDMTIAIVMIMTITITIIVIVSKNTIIVVIPVTMITDIILTSERLVNNMLSIARKRLSALHRSNLLSRNGVPPLPSRHCMYIQNQTPRQPLVSKDCLEVVRPASV